MGTGGALWVLCVLGQAPSAESLKMPVRAYVNAEKDRATETAYFAAGQMALKAWMPALCKGLAPRACTQLETLLTMDQARVVKIDVKEQVVEKAVAPLPPGKTRKYDEPLDEKTVAHLLLTGDATPDMARVVDLTALATWVQTRRSVSVELAEQSAPGQVFRTAGQRQACAPPADELLTEMGLITKPGSLLSPEQVVAARREGVRPSPALLRAARDGKVDHPVFVDVYAGPVPGDSNLFDVRAQVEVGSTRALENLGQTRALTRAECGTGNALDTMTCSRATCRNALRPALLDAFTQAMKADARLGRRVDVLVEGADAKRLNALALALGKAVPKTQSATVDALPDGRRCIVLRVEEGDENSVAELLDGKALAGVKLGVQGLSAGQVELSAGP